ncbi:MAG: hypothetical protein R3F59_12895 [Myxococcota bacterium]
MDWIDASPPTRPRGRPSWEDLAVAVKDRLLADPTLAPGEADAVADLWRLPDLGDADRLDLGGHRPAARLLRRADDPCEFLLTRDTHRSGAPGAAADPVCLRRAARLEAAWAEHYAP